MLNMPLLDNITPDKNLVGKFISGILLHVLISVEGNEKVNLKQRQAEEIIVAKGKGVKFGRSKIVLPNLTQVYY